MMNLMQKYIKENDAVDVNNLHCWPLNSDVFKFLSAMMSVISVMKLLKVY